MATTIMLGISDLESPNVVAEFRPADQFGIGQIGQITKYGRLIKPLRNEKIGKLCMGLGAFGLSQGDEYGDSCRSTPQSDSP
jgi:hypothetical protein